MAKEKKVLVEVPERLAKVLERLVKADALGEQMASGTEKLDWRRLSSEIEAAGAAAEREISRRALQRLDERGKNITVDGKTYRRVGRHEGTYYTKAGPVTLLRSLYRNAAVRNDKTVDAIALKLGCVEDGWLPETADAMACLLQSVPAGEAEKLAAKLGRVQYSASSFNRVGTAVGGLYEAQRGDIEDALIEACVIPDKTHSLTVSLDRVALPMEIDVPRKAGRPKKDAPKRSIARVFEMAWVGTVSLVDAKGEALHTIRYGAVATKMPEKPDQLLESMLGDVRALLAKQPGLKVTAVCDGAKDLVDLLDANFTQASLGVAVTRLVDFWHVIEKLGKATTVMFGAAGSQRLGQWKLRLLNSPHAPAQILRELHDSGRESRRSAKRCLSMTPSRTSPTKRTGWATLQRVPKVATSEAAVSRPPARASCRCECAAAVRAGSVTALRQFSLSALSRSAIAGTERWNSRSNPSVATSSVPRDQHETPTHRPSR